MRKLSSDELYDGMFVQCVDHRGGLHQEIYQINIRDGKHFYRSMGSDWEMSGELVKEIWAETEKTLSLNRDRKLEKLEI